MRRCLVLGLVLAGCLDVTEGPKPMCVATADCDAANGEVCDSGICYGNPPSGSFAAVVSPPSERTDLIARQVLGFTIPPDGRFADVHLDEPVTIGGTIIGCQPPLPCDSTSLAATITVTGAPSFAGGPSYLGVFDAADTTGFTLRLPKSRDSEQYDVVVQPGGRDAEPSAGTTPAQIVPPLHLRVAAVSGLAPQIVDLGTSAANVIVSGKIATAQNAPVGNYRVVALGHWDPDAPLVEVSTVDYVGTDGLYQLRLSAGLSGSVQIVATGYRSGVRPVLTLGSVSTQQDSANTNLVMPDRLGMVRSTQVTVEGVDGSGTVGPVAGARVVITGQAHAGATTATIVAAGTTDERGLAKKLDLLDGEDLAATYMLTVVPPANSSVGVVINRPITLAALGDHVRLPDRLALHGVVRDHDGNPVKDIAVTARPSVRFLWSLEPSLQSVLSAIPPATTVTPQSGEFVVFVDRALGDIWGHYDLVFEGTSSSQLPTYQAPELDLPRDASVPSLALADITLPDAAYIHGDVVDPMGRTVEGAELKVYELPAAALTVCSEVLHAPASCPVPARLLGRGTSSKSGELRVILPRP